MIPDIAVTVAQLTLVTLIAALYPVGVARNITPLDAISKD
jgi:ABC-type lipoprotein release transport system permease subunit